MVKELDIFILDNDQPASCPYCGMRRTFLTKMILNSIIGAVIRSAIMNS